MSVVVLCAGAAFVVSRVVPWRYWYDKPETGVLGCDMAGNAAMAAIEVTNWSWSDRTYAVTVVVRDRRGAVVGSQEGKVEVPSRHTRRTTLVVVTRSAGEDCEISRAEPA